AMVHAVLNNGKKSWSYRDGHKQAQSQTTNECSCNGHGGKLPSFTCNRLAVKFICVPYDFFKAMFYKDSDGLAELSNFLLYFCTSSQIDFMKILVCIAQVPDTTSKIVFTENNTKFNQQGVTMIINPYDEWYSLVRALELKEAGKATAIHLVTVGLADAEPVMRKALALGGDEAFRIDVDS